MDQASTSAAPMLSLDGITKTYGRNSAVDHVSLEIAAGEFVTLLGPSGSGKTTCLRIVAGIVKPDSGRLLIAGRDVLRTPMHKRNIGMVFQNYSLFPHMTVAQNVAYPLRVRGVGRDSATSRVSNALEMVQLERLSDRRPDQLSGGQQQRVALARALVFDPDVLLLDEPLSALDRVLREGMQLELRRIHETTGTTMVCVTHDRSEALTMSDRVIVLRDGRVVQDASPREIYRNSNSRFVAEFLGETNVIPMRARRAGDTGVLTDAVGREVAVPAERMPDAAEVDVVFRVETVEVVDADLAGSRSGGPTAFWEGHVREAVFLGEAIRYVIDCEPHRIVARVPLSAVAQTVVQGSRVQVVLDPDDAMVFPSGTVDQPAARP